ncbi:MAG: hypothetical protein E6G92_13625 [Alphaproteobacteria bacterium]|nr:MAG: hypothetical protein E6G92_13625 [Alphaproteobacteria bacterium]
MTKAAHIVARSAAIAALLALAACNRGGDNNLAEVDNSLIGNGADPALTSALEDQILVDPNLVQQARPNTARPPETPVQAQYPAGSAGPSGGQANSDMQSACGIPFTTGNSYAQRLPAQFPIYPGGRLTEAAGADRGDCHIRVVTFTTPDPAERVLGHYRGLATRGGFSVEQQTRGADQVLGGVNGDAAYYLIVSPQGTGSDVSLIVNNGR